MGDLVSHLKFRFKQDFKSMFKSKEMEIRVDKLSIQLKTQTTGNQTTGNQTVGNQLVQKKVESKLKGIDQIYVIIDKEKEPDRFEYVDGWMSENGIVNKTYLMYCWKDTLTKQDIQTFYDHNPQMYWKKFTTNYFNNKMRINECRRLSDTEISLVINHIKVLEDVVRNGYESVLILESDVIFEEDFIKRWNEEYIDQVPKDWDVVILGSGNSNHSKMKEGFTTPLTKTEGKRIYYNPRFMVKCTEATLFTQSACKRILEGIIPFHAPIDHEYDYHLSENRLNVYMCEPPLVINGSETKVYESVVQSEHGEEVDEFYSQIGQDRYYVEKIIKRRRNGIFLDIGAHDGVTFSNTYYLEKNLGWTGLCVEPNPSSYDKCIRNRTCNVVNKAILEGQKGKAEFIIPEGEGKVEGGLEQLCALKGHVRDKSLRHDFATQYSKQSTIMVDTTSIMDLLNEHQMYAIDYMSIDVEGYELDILKGIDYEKVKVRFLTIEHGNDEGYRKEICDFLASKGYERHRENKWDDEYMLKALSVNSFDIFDTLLTRKCKKPTEIFGMIEEGHMIQGFKDFRIKAEQMSNGTFDDIYRKFAELTGISDNTVYNLKNIEILKELENIFPIKCNTKLIKDGDIVVSDMYYPPKILEAFLRTVGVENKVEIFASPAGKATGEMWKKLNAKFDIVQHIGDNQHSDVKMARDNGINGVVTDVFRHSAVEELVGGELGDIIRQFRLRNEFEESTTEHMLYDEQCRANIMILCLFAVQIRGIMEVEGRNKLLLCMRDCCLLENVFRYFYGDVQCSAFWSSRIMNRNYNEEYKGFVKSMYDDKSLIVDFNGSFESGRRLFMEAFGKLPRVHLLCYNRACEGYDGLTYSTTSDEMDDYIERLNPGTSGTLYNYYEGMLYMKVCENNRKYVEIIHDTTDEFIRYIEEKNVKRKLLLNLHRIVLDENLSRAIMSKRGFTYRYDNVITNA